MDFVPLLCEGQGEGELVDKLRQYACKQMHKACCGTGGFANEVPPCLVLARRYNLEQCQELDSIFREHSSRQDEPGLNSDKQTKAKSDEKPKAQGAPLPVCSSPAVHVTRTHFSAALSCITMVRCHDT